VFKWRFRGIHCWDGDTHHCRTDDGPPSWSIPRWDLSPRSCEFLRLHLLGCFIICDRCRHSLCGRWDSHGRGRGRGVEVLSGIHWGFLVVHGQPLHYRQPQPTRSDGECRGVQRRSLCCRHIYECRHLHQQHAVSDCRQYGIQWNCQQWGFQPNGSGQSRLPQQNGVEGHSICPYSFSFTFTFFLPIIQPIAIGLVYPFHVIFFFSFLFDLCIPVTFAFIIPFTFIIAFVI